MRVHLRAVRPEPSGFATDICLALPLIPGKAAFLIKRLNVKHTDSCRDWELHPRVRERLAAGQH